VLILCSPAYFCLPEDYDISLEHVGRSRNMYNLYFYEGWNFNFGNAAVTFDTVHLQSSYFHRPSMYSPALCRIRSQRWGSRMMPLAAPVLSMVRTERPTAAYSVAVPSLWISNQNHRGWCLVNMGDGTAPPIAISPVTVSLLQLHAAERCRAEWLVSVPT
jgi:hypothetical protein